MSKITLQPLREIPEYAEAVEKQTQISIALGEVNSQILEVERRLAQGVEARDALAVAGELMANPDAPLRSDDVQSLRDEHLALRKRRDIYSEALRLQGAEVDRLGVLFSRSASLQAAQQHKRIAQKALDALKAFDQAQVEEQALLLELHRAGFEQSSVLESVAWPLLGSLAEGRGASLIDGRVRELEQYVSRPLPPQPKLAARVAVH